MKIEFEITKNSVKYCFKQIGLLISSLLFVGVAFISGGTTLFLGIMTFIFYCSIRQPPSTYMGYDNAILILVMSVFATYGAGNLYHLCYKQFEKNERQDQETASVKSE